MLLETFANIMHARDFLKKIFVNFRKFSQTFQQPMFVVQSGEKNSAWLVWFFEKYAKIMKHSRFSLVIF